MGSLLSSTEDTIPYNIEYFFWKKWVELTNLTWN